MIDVSAAVQLIRDAARPVETESIRLADAIGRVLADPVISDGDAPPFDKSMMDGFAISTADYAAGRTSFQIVDCVVAGQAAPSGLSAGTAVQIMTGAPIPKGADAVVMIEETSASPLPSPLHQGEGRTVTIRSEKIRAGQHIMKRGKIYCGGDHLLSAGHRISAHDIGLLAEAGASQLAVRRLPVVGVIATGNEIVSPEQKPGIGQIRNSNGPLLLGMVAAQHAQPIDLGTARDEEQALSAAIRRGLASDVLVLTGGVSAGMLDLVPRVLQSLGVQQVFHKISLKPGKPVWFGVHDSGQRRCLVFGLPGNPVSAFVCFHLLVKEALAVLNGQRVSSSESASSEPQAQSKFKNPDRSLAPGFGGEGRVRGVSNSVGGSETTMSEKGDPPQRAFLEQSHEIRGDRPTYWPSRLNIVDGRAVVEPLPWQGSADQRCLSHANCLAFFPVGDQTYPAGSLVEIREL